MLEKIDRVEEAAGKYEHVARICEERGAREAAAQWRARAEAMRGGAAPEGDLPASLGDMMGLRTLQEGNGASSPPNLQQKDERDSFWGRPEEPAGLGEERAPARSRVSRPRRAPPPTPSVAAAPWKVYDPAANPDLPPPPPLPGRAPQADSAPPAHEPPAEAAPAELEEVATGPAAEPAFDEPEAAPAPEADSVPLAELPGVIMPPAKPESAPAEAPVSEEKTAPASKEADKSQLLSEFFESAAAPTGQAVVIGDDFELVREGGDVTEVIADFRNATSEILDLDDFQSHYDLGMTYLEMELFDEAASEFEMAARGEHFALASQEMLGYCFLRRGQIDLAISELRKGLEIPGHGDRDRLGLLYNLGIACGVTDQEEEAIDCFRRILEIDPEFRDARSRLERLVQNSA
jgi:hypothetical protein